MTDLPTIPVSLRVHLAHATLQAIAEECGADVLHIKGPTVDPSLRPTSRSSVDADVLVRPAHMRRILYGLRRFGWTEVIGLPSGGLVEHSTNWYHGELGQVDVHVRFPGIQIEPGLAFDRLWEGRSSKEIAHRPCAAPRMEVQRLILILHAARSSGRRAEDIQHAWIETSDGEHDSVIALARELKSEVAIGAATGRLEQYRDRPEYVLWRFYTDGVAETRHGAAALAAAKAATEGAHRVRGRTVLYLLSLLWNKPQRLSAQLQREPTHVEVIRAYWLMFGRGVDGLRLLVAPLMGYGGVVVHFAVAEPDLASAIDSQQHLALMESLLSCRRESVREHLSMATVISLWAAS